MPRTTCLDRKVRSRKPSRWTFLMQTASNINRNLIASMAHFGGEGVRASEHSFPVMINSELSALLYRSIMSAQSDDRSKILLHAFFVFVFLFFVSAVECATRRSRMLSGDYPFDSFSYLCVVISSSQRDLSFCQFCPRWRWCS